MDGMTYSRNARDTRLPVRYTGTVPIVRTAAFIIAMIALTLLLHALGWAPPGIEQLGC